MKKITTILTLLLLAVAGAWANPVTVIVADGSHQPYDYFGTRTDGTTFTSNDASGLAGLTIVAPVMDRATWWETYCLALKPSSVQTAEAITISAPAGYKIYGYSITLQAISSSNPYEITVGSNTQTVTGASAYTFNEKGVNATSTSFTIKQTSETANWLAVKDWTLTLLPENEEYTTVSSLAAVNQNKSYTIVNPRGWWAVASGATDVNSTVELELPKSFNDVKQQFAIVKYEDAYYLYSVSEKKFAYVNGTKISLTNTEKDLVLASPLTLEESVHSGKDTYPVIITLNGKHFGVSTNYSPDIYQYQSTNDEGNGVSLVETADFDPTEALNFFSSEDVKTFVTDLSQLTNDKIYVIYNARGAWNFADNATGMNAVATPDRGTVSQQVAIITHDNEYYLYSVNNKKYVRADNTLGAPVPVQIVATENTDYPWQFKFDDSHVVNVDGARNVYFNTWGIIDEGNSNAILEAGEYDLSEALSAFDVQMNYVTDLNQLENNKAYIVSNVRGTWQVADGSNELSATTSGVVLDNVNEQMVIWKQNDKYYLYSVSAKKFVNRTKSLSTLPQAVTIEQKGTNDNYLWFFKFDDSHIINGSTTYVVIDDWNTIDEGNVNQIIEAGDFSEDLSPYFELKDRVASEVKPWFETNVGSYFALKQSTYDEYKARYEAALTTCSPEEYEALTAATYEINYPETGYYRLKNVSHATHYLGYDGSSDEKNLATFEDEGKSLATVVKLEKNDNGQYAIMINGKYAPAASKSARMIMSDEPAYFYAQEYTPGTAYFSVDYGQYTYLHCAATDKYYAVGWEYNAEASLWTVEDATSATVALNGPVDDSYYATFYAPFDVTIEGVDAYTVAVDGSNAVTTQVEGNKVAAGTAVLLKGAAGEATVTINNGEALAAQTSALAGTYLDMDVDGATDYFFGKNNDKVGFYHWTGTTLKANRAYLPASAVSANETKGLAINWNGDADGINAVATDNVGEQTVFDLQGRRVNKMQRGLYIVNGKKVVVK